MWKSCLVWLLPADDQSVCLPTMQRDAVPVSHWRIVSTIEEN